MRIIDLMVEFRNFANGRRLAVGGQAGALLWCGQSTKTTFLSDTSPQNILQRLQAVASMFWATPLPDLGLALLRGRYMRAVADIEATGVPVDQVIAKRLANDWPSIRAGIVAAVDRSFGVYSGTHLDPVAFSDWLQRRGLKWPISAYGQLDTGADVFREMVRAYPELRPLKELQTTLVGFEPTALMIGRDGRNRVPMRAFASRTGRNQPSAKASVLGPAAWVRHLIKPELGTALAMIDWCQQEFGVAAALSGDQAMLSAYCSSDPYLALAIHARSAPANATAETHSQVRDRFKACVLGSQYGIGAVRLARLLSISEHEAKELLSAQKSAFPRFWAWSDAIETSALLSHEQQTVFGWRIAVGADDNPRSIRNFPMQANGAEMLRLACCLAIENDIMVCAAIHDALLIQAPIEEIENVVARTQRLMAEASAVVLDGFELRTSVRIVRAPDLWTDDRGQAVWSAIKTILNSEIEPACKRDATCSSARPRPILLSHKKSVS